MAMDKEAVFALLHRLRMSEDDVTTMDAQDIYLANGYSRHCLSECNLINHINSAIDVFNCRCDISTLIPKIKEMLRIKYNLIIIKDNPMILKKYY